MEKDDDLRGAPERAARSSTPYRRYDEPHSRVVTVILGIAILGLVGWIASQPRPRPRLPEGPGHAAAGQPGVASARTPGEVAAPPPELGHAGRALETPSRPLPGSLVGTEVDGALVVDADGRFVPTPDALALFDYFLAASGEEPPGVIEARIRAEIAARLDGEAAVDANRLLDQYLELRVALRELTAQGDVPHDLERRLQWIRELRREVFGRETAAALYGESEDVLAIDLERRRVATDPTLSDAERADALAGLEAELPERVRAARARAGQPARVHREVAALRAAGADPAEIHAARAREFGPEAADRLAALDAEREAWRARLDVYRAERDALLAEADEGEAQVEDDLDVQLAALRASHFDERDALRVRELDRAELAALARDEATAPAVARRCWRGGQRAVSADPCRARARSVRSDPASAGRPSAGRTRS